jgi:hypothetical protein
VGLSEDAVVWPAVHFPLLPWYFISIERPSVSANPRENFAKARLIIAQSACPATA